MDTVLSCSELSAQSTKRLGAVTALPMLVTPRCQDRGLYPTSVTKPWNKAEFNFTCIYHHHYWKNAPFF